MRKQTLLAFSAILSVAACTEANVTSPADDGLISGPSFAIVDAGHDGPVDGFWFLPPLAKQVTTQGFLDESLEPGMQVCELEPGIPSEFAPGGSSDLECTSTVVTTFDAGTASMSPGSNYQFSWDTSPDSPDNDLPMDPTKYYRINILIGDAVLGYLDVNPQNPSGQSPGDDYEDLYAFRLGENLPVKFFISPQARCSLAEQEGYVIQCAAQGVIDATGGVLTLPPEQSGWPTISVVVPPGALPLGYPTVIMTIERIDPVLFASAPPVGTGEECIPGLAGIPGFDAPMFGDCLRVTTDPVLPDGVLLEAEALIEICLDFESGDYPGLKLGEEQDARLQIIRYDDGVTQGLTNVDATTCGAQALPSPSVLGFFPVPKEQGFLRTAAVAANTVARWFGPEPLAAHGAIKLAGSTSEFSRFRWGLPGEMVKAAGDNLVIQQLEGGTEGYDHDVTVEVVDAGSPDVLPLPLVPSTIAGATVHFSGAAGVSQADVTTGDDGLATTTWTVPSTGPGVYTLEAKALGLLSTAVPVHDALLTFGEATVTFTATVVGVPATPAQSPASDTELNGLPGETLDTPLTITVVDANGLPVVGWPVTWTTDCSASDPSLCDGWVGDDTDGDPGNDTGAGLVTDENGQATGYWTLATTPGTNTLRVTVGSQTFDFVAGTWTATGGCLVDVNGTVGAGEWDCAVSAGNTEAFMANISGGAVPAEVRWQTDGADIYFLVLVQQSSLDKVNSLRLDFDNTGGGASGDDDIIGFTYNGSGTGATAVTTFDRYLTDRCVNRSQSSCGADDTSAGGTLDVQGAIGNAGGFTVYELSHPLSGDSKDFDLTAGDVGFFLTLSIGKGAQGNTQVPGFRNYGWVIEGN